MLPAATRCLESRCCLLHTHGRRGRRLLHSTFWDHAASKFDLPSYAVDLGAHDHLAKSKSSIGTETAAGLNAEGPLLEFLYPPQALALLARPLPRSLETGVRKRAWSSARKFSSYPRVEKNEHVRKSPLKPSTAQSPLDVLKGALSTAPQISKHRQKPKFSPRVLARRRFKRLGSEAFAKEAFKARNNGIARVLETYESENHESGEPTKSKSVADKLASPADTECTIDLTGDPRQDAAQLRGAVQTRLQKVGPDAALDVLRYAMSQKIKHDFGAGVLLAYYCRHNQHVDAASLSWAIRLYAERMDSPLILADCLDDLQALPLPRLSSSFAGLLRSMKEGTISLGSGSHLLIHQLSISHIRRLNQAQTPHEFHRGASAIEFVCAQLQRALLESTTGSINGLWEALILEALQIDRVFHRRWYSRAISRLWSCYSNRITFQPNLTFLGKLLKAMYDKKIVHPLPPERRFPAPLTVDAIHNAWLRGGQLSYTARIHLMGLYADMGAVDKVDKLVADYVAVASAENLQLDPRFFASSIRVHAVRRDAVAAQNAFDRLSNDFEVEPNAEAWDILQRAYERADDLEGALECFGRRLESNVELTPHGLTQVMTLYAQSGNPTAVTDLMALAEQESIPINTHMINALIVAHARAGNDETAMTVLAQTIEQQKAGHIPGALTLPYNSVLTMHAERREHHRTVETYRRMRMDGVPLDSATFVALIVALTARRRPDSAKLIVRKIMPEYGVPPTIEHFRPILHSYVRIGDFLQAIAIGDRMLKNGIALDLTSRAAYLEAKASLRRYRKPPKKGPLTSSAKVVEDLLQVIKDDPIFSLQNEFEHRRMPSIAVSNLFESLLRLHGPEACRDAAMQLYESLQTSSAEPAEPAAAPFRLNVALMSIFGHLGDREKVQWCWDLLTQQSEHLLHSPSAFLGPAAPLQIDNTINASLRGRLAEQETSTSVSVDRIEAAQDVETENNDADQSLVATSLAELPSDPMDALSSFLEEEVSPEQAKKKKKKKKKKDKSDDPENMLFVAPATPSPSQTSNAQALRMEMSLPFKIYSKLVLSMPDTRPSHVTAIMTTVFTLLRRGFELDNNTINSLVVSLCALKPSRTLLAFMLVERFLKPDEFAWERPLQLVPTIRRFPNRITYANDTQHIDWPKHAVAPLDRLPLYSTMVWLAHSLISARQREYNTPKAQEEAKLQAEADADMEFEEFAERRGQVGGMTEIEKTAPNTLEKVLQIPITFDPLQSKLIHGGEGKYIYGGKGRYAYAELGLGGIIKYSTRKRSEQAIDRKERAREATAALEEQFAKYGMTKTHQRRKAWVDNISDIISARRKAGRVKAHKERLAAWKAKREEARVTAEARVAQILATKPKIDGQPRRVIARQRDLSTNGNALTVVRKTNHRPRTVVRKLARHPVAYRRIDLGLASTEKPTPQSGLEIPTLDQKPDTARSDVRSRSSRSHASPGGARVAWPFRRRQDQSR